MKKLLFLLILLFPCLAYAQNTQSAQTSDSFAFYTIDDFSKGLQSHTTPFNTPDGIANDNLNVRTNIQTGALSKRTPQIAYSSCYAGAVTSLHRYYRATPDTYLSLATKSTIENIDQYIYYSSDAGVCVPIGQGKSAGKHWSWLTYKDIAIGTDGYDAPVKWDGASLTTDDTLYGRTSGDLVTELGAPFANLAAGSNLDATSWYQYKVAILNATGQYYFEQARSNPIKTGSTYKGMLLTDVPLGQTGTTYRYIYRTVGNASRTAVLADSSYYLVGKLSDNSTRVFYDNVSDATLLGDAAPTWATATASGINMTPPYAKFSTLVSETTFFANRPDGTAQGKSTIYASEVYNPDLFNTNSSGQTFLIRPDDGDEITMLQVFLGQLYIGKNNSIIKIYTTNYYGQSTSVSSWVVSQPFSFVGVTAPYSVAVMPLGILYLNWNGIYLFNGQSSELISDSVTKDIRNISPTAMGDVTGVYWNNEYNMAYADSSTGSSINNRVLVFDFARKSFVKDSKYIESWAKFNSGTDFNTLYAGTSQSTGAVSAQSSSPSIFSTRYETDLDQGTFTETTDSVAPVDNNFPILQLGWTVTVDDSSFGTTTVGAYTLTDAIVARKQKTGNWVSPVYDLNVAKFDKLYWNQYVGTYGSLTFAVRSADTSGGIPAASWSSEYSNPSGSDVSALTPHEFVQFRASLTTTDIAYSPYLQVSDDFLFKLTYSKVGATSESSVLALWQSGYQDLNPQLSQYPKLLQECDVYYTGTSGIINIAFNNLKGDLLGSLNVDLSHVRDPANGYFGDINTKVFRYNFPIYGTSANYLVGDKFRVTITEDSTNSWSIQRLALKYAPQGYIPYK